MQQFRTLVAAGLAGSAGVKPQSARYAGNAVYRVPTVCLVGNIIVEGMLSDGPEFVPAEVLAAAPQAWDGVIVTTGHPPDGNANSPDIHDSEGIGRVFHSHYSDGALQCELWIDPLACARQGEDGERVLASVLAGETLEVSVGAWIFLERASGTLGGKSYSYRWMAAPYPNHIAVGLYRHSTTGHARGACSIADGCGANRILSQRILTTKGGLTMCDLANCSCNVNAELAAIGLTPAHIEASTPVDPYGIPSLAKALGYKPTPTTVQPAQPTAAALAALGPDAPTDPWCMPAVQAVALGYRPHPDAK